MDPLTLNVCWEALQVKLYMLHIPFEMTRLALASSSPYENFNIPLPCAAKE